MLPLVMVATDATGAARAASLGQVVVIVDVIDMSTTLEAALDEGALAVFGAAPDTANPPVPVNPRRVGWLAGKYALEKKTGLILVAEPRTGSHEERLSGIQKVVQGIVDIGGVIEVVLPNLGAETIKLADMKGRVVVAVSKSGGIAFDAALTAGAPAVLTGTIARTGKKKGKAPALAAANRAIETARRLKTDVALVAASGNSLEDLLAAEYLFGLMVSLLRSPEKEK